MFYLPVVISSDESRVWVTKSHRHYTGEEDGTATATATSLHDFCVQGRRSLWDRGTCSPNNYEGGTSMVISPNILEVLFILSSNSSNCCLLYFNANIMCIVSQKASDHASLLLYPPKKGPNKYFSRWRQCPRPFSTRFLSQPNLPVAT